jgi:hypothetical protein
MGINRYRMVAVLGIAVVAAAAGVPSAGGEAGSSPFPFSLELRPPAAVVPGQQATYQLTFRSRIHARSKEMVVTANVFSGTLVGASVKLRFAKGHGKTFAYLDVPPLAALGERTIRLSVVPSSSAFSLNVGAGIPSDDDYYGEHATVATAPNTRLATPFRLSVELSGPSHFKAHRPCVFRTLVRNVGDTTLDGVVVSIAPINPLTLKLLPFTTPWTDLVRTPTQVFARLPPLPPGATVPVSVRFIAPALNRKVLGLTYYAEARTTTDGQPSPFVNASLAVTPHALKH